MFYTEVMDDAYRFGDVLRGYFISNTNINYPYLERQISEKSYHQIDVFFPEFCVILTPCCSIGDGIIKLTPLIKVMKDFFDNPYLAGDLTRLNREMEPEQSVSPRVWEGLGEEERARRLSSVKGYASYEYFIYEQNPLLPKYNIKEIEIGYYMIDFKNIFKVNCNRIPNAKQAPMEAKCLQLSIEARRELREKISYYFWRPAEEDEISTEY